MKIALDYDLTYSLDPKMWDAVFRYFQISGHEVRIVTVRDDRYDRTAPLVELEKKLPVIYTRGVAKRWHISNFVKDFMPDVWIDDKPESVDSNSTFAPDALEKWRVDRNEGPCEEVVLDRVAEERPSPEARPESKSFDVV